MPTPTIPDGELFMNATLYTGTGAGQTLTNGVAGQSFQPDFVWIKVRSTTYDHNLYDSVRGVQNVLNSNGTYAQNVNGSADLTAFNSNGFTIRQTSNYELSANGATYVAWQWKAGGTAVTNTAGSISAQVSANTTSGFSVVTWTGNGASSATIGHGLGVAPSMIIVKNRSATWGWFVYNRFLTNPNTGRLQLNLTNAEIAGGTPGPWNNTAPTSTVFSLGDSSFPEVNGSGNLIVAYCWAPIAGYSAFGSYTGNGSTDGPFVYLGFRPRFILTKAIQQSSQWFIWDSSRSPFNASNDCLFPESSQAETANNSALDVDFLSNGFKIRNTGSGQNNSGFTYIYMAFCENPFKFANAR